MDKKTDLNEYQSVQILKATLTKVAIDRKSFWRETLKNKIRKQAKKLNLSLPFY